MAHLSLGKPQSLQKAFLMDDELEVAKRSLTQKKEDMRQLEERLQRLEIAQVRQTRRWKHKRATRSFTQ